LKIFVNKNLSVEEGKQKILAIDKPDEMARKWFLKRISKYLRWEIFLETS